MCSVTYFNCQVVHLPCYCRNNSTCGSVNVSIVLLYVAPSFAGAVRGNRVGRKQSTRTRQQLVYCLVAMNYSFADSVLCTELAGRAAVINVQ